MWLLLILALKFLAVKDAVAGGDELDPGKFLMVQTVSALTNEFIMLNSALLFQPASQKKRSNLWTRKTTWWATSPERRPWPNAGRYVGRETAPSSSPGITPTWRIAGKRSKVGI